MHPRKLQRQHNAAGLGPTALKGPKNQVGCIIEGRSWTETLFRHRSEVSIYLRLICARQVKI